MDLRGWLEQLELPQYAEAFTANHIDEKTLASLTADDLKEIGVASLGHRKMILAAIAERRFAPRPSALDPTRLPSLLALSLHEYLHEQHPVLKLWHSCDFIELTLRLLVGLGLAELRRGGPLSGELVQELRARIQRPTLGEWRVMAEAVARRLPPQSALPELPALVSQTLAPLLDGPDRRRTPESSFSELRNRLAHGGGVTRRAAERLLSAWQDRFEAAVGKTAWLAEVALVVSRGESGLGVMRGPSREPVPFTPDTPETLAKLLAVFARENGVVAVRGHTMLPLWPLARYGPPRSPDPDALIPTDPAAQVYARRGEVRLHYTPIGHEEVSVSQGDQHDLDEFLRLFALGEPEIEVRRRGFEVRGFEDDLRKDASEVVGRHEELLTLRSAVEETRGGILWLTGPAGIGKSYLLAKLAINLIDDPLPETLFLPYRMKAGDDRCLRDAFLRFSLERLVAWCGFELTAEPAEGARRKRLLQRLADLLSGVPASVRVVFLLDGLDEIAERDPKFAEEVPLALARPNVAWLCAGRSERGLDQVFRADRCRHVYPGGVPLMQPGEIRTLLLEKIGPLRKRLLLRDREEGQRVVNPFVERVAHHARGLPLYVKYVIGDILGNRYRTFDSSERPPPSLADYHEELLRRCSIGSLQQVLTPLVTVLAVAREPLSPAQLLEMLVDRFLAPATEPGRRLLEQGLSAIGSMLRSASTPQGEGYTLYHHSLRQHITNSPATRDAVFVAQRYLADRSTRLPLPAGSPLTPYCVRHGVRHLVDCGMFPEAVAFLQYLHERPTAEHLGTEHLPPLDRLLAVALKDCPEEQARRIDPRNLAAILKRVEDFEPLYAGIRLLYTHHAGQWQQILDEFLNSTLWWSLMYTCSLVVADSYQERPDASKLAQVHALIRSEDLGYQELGSYAAKIIGARQPERIDARLLGEMAASDSWMVRGVLGELLLYLTLNGARPRALVTEGRFWQPVWDYNQVLVDDILAAEQFARSGPPDANLPTGVQESYQFLKETEQARRELLAGPEVQGEPALAALLEGYYVLPIHLDRIRAAESAIERSAGLKAILRVMLATPYWEVREAVGAVAMTLAETRPEVLGLVAALLQDPNWRLRYAAVALAHGVGHLDENRLFFEGVRRLVSDRHSWLRGLSAECLKMWLLNAPAEERAARVSSFEWEIQTLVRDEDSWTLEQVYRLFHELFREGCDLERLIVRGVSPLLQGHPRWFELEPHEFRQLIERNKCRQSARPGSPA